ncbi:MAG: TonB-dependent receptor, partial [Alphaproteobacteria bacterium]
MSGSRARIAFLLGSCLFGSPAFAQDQERGAAQRSSSEIVVTALKRSDMLATVPAPVSVVDGDDIRERAITTAERLARFSASLTVLPNPTANIIFLRGVGNFTLTPSSDPAIGWNYDGVFVGRPNGTNGQFYDLDQVEILKGPQGVLYGRNASGGTINLVPTHPKPGIDEASLAASYGSRNTTVLEGALNLALGAKGALRVSGQMLAQDSYLEGFNGSRQNALRVQLASDLTPSLTVRIASDYTHQGGVGQGTTYLGYYLYDSATSAYRLVQSGLPLDTGNRASASQTFRRTVPLTSLGRTLDAQAAVPYQDNALMGAHADVTADLGFATLNVLPAWRYSDFDQVPPGAPFGYKYLEKIEQRSVEMRISSGSGGHLT